MRAAEAIELIDYLYWCRGAVLRVAAELDEVASATTPG